MGRRVNFNSISKSLGNLALTDSRQILLKWRLQTHTCQELPSHRQLSSETHTSRWRCKYDHPVTVQDCLDLFERAWRRCRRSVVLQFPIPRSTFANTDSLRQLPLGQTRENSGGAQLPPSDNFRHQSVSSYLPIEGNCPA